MRNKQTNRIERRTVARALTVAIVGVAMALPFSSARAFVAIRPGGGPVNGAGGGPVVPPTGTPPAPKPEPGVAGEPGVAPERDPGGLMDRAAESGSQVYVDDSFASVDKLRTALRYAKSEQSQLAIQEFQQIVANFGQKLVYLNDGSYASITDYVREKMLQMPAVKQGMYDQLYGADAKEAIDTAVAKRDLGGLMRACDRFFPSTAALGGLSQAAEWYFERGEFEAAARVWQQLLVHPMAAKMKPELLFRAASAESLANNTVATKALRARLEKEFPEATGTVSGKDVKLLAKLDELIAMPAWEANASGGSEDWPAFGGGASRSRLLDTNPSIGARLWSIPLSDEATVAAADATSQSLEQRRIAIARRGGGMVQADLDGTNNGIGAFAVLAGGALLINTGDRVESVSANAGTKLYEYPKTPPSASAMTQQMLMQRQYGVSFRPSTHNSVAVYNDQVYAMMTGGSTNVMQGNDQIMYNNGSLAMGTRVVCLKREGLDEVWSRNATDVKVDNKGALAFVGSPTVTRQGVFIMARRQTDPSFTQQYLVRLDRETGEPTWSCYLCSTSSGQQYGYPGAALGPIAVPTIVDDVVYITTGQGADCAVDANAGRILWLRVVESGEKNLQGQSFNPQGLMVTSPWKFNPPIIIGDRMYSCDNGTALRVYDRWNGKMISKVPAADLDMTRIDLMSGALGTHLVMSGSSSGQSQLLSVDVNELAKRDGKGAPVAGMDAKIAPDWKVEVTDAGKAVGRAFLTTAAYYVPFERKLVHVDVKTAKVDAWEWPNNEKNVPGKPGNLLVTSEQVVVMNDLEIAGYSKWETARDNRLAAIKANPKDPEPHLALAEIGYRTGHAEVAHESMKNAVDLANASEATAGAAGKPMAELLKRLYQTNLNFAEQLLVKSDTGLRDESRFYYEQCRASARDPEQQAEWRLRLAELSLKQKKPEEAATLYSEVLSDPALRAAMYREGENIASAGTTSEQRMRRLITETGAGVYKRFEDQAAALLGKSRAGRDLNGLQQVVDAYPNSKASLDAATDLAAAYRDKQDWESARRVLWWLEPRAQGEAQARAIADLVQVCLGLKKYPSAAAWAARGARQFKDPFVSSRGQKITFADIRKDVAASGVPDVDGRLPMWHGDPLKKPPMDLTPLDEKNLLVGKLLAPAEASPAYRQPNLLFTQSADTVRIYDVTKGNDSFVEVKLPMNQPAMLLGATPTTAVLMQRDRAIGVDLKTKATWSVKLDAVPAAAGGGGAGLGVRGRVVIAPNQVNQVNQVVIIGGQQVIVGPEGVMMDSNGTVIPRGLQGTGDAETMRRSAILSLGDPGFFTARLLNNRLVIVSGNQVRAFDTATGQPVWKTNGAETRVRLPEGTPVALVGNEDLLVMQQDSADGTSSTFFAIDADTGNIHKQLKLEGDRASWRAVGDDGTLFVITDQAVSAYDLVGDGNRQIWKTPIQTRFASATALTLDGIVLVDNNMNAMCLSLDSGERRWPVGSEIRLPLEAQQGAVMLRSMVDGDTVVFQTTQPGSVALRSQTGAIAWKGSYLGDTPMLLGMQGSDLYMMELAMGPSAQNNASRAVRVIFRDRKGGKLASSVPITNGVETRDGPMLKGWQVLDAGIAFESADGVHFWRNLEK